MYFNIAGEMEELLVSDVLLHKYLAYLSLFGIMKRKKKIKISVSYSDSCLKRDSVLF